MPSQRFHTRPQEKRRHLRHAILVAPAILACLAFLATRPTIVWVLLLVLAVISLVGSLAAWRQTRPLAEVTDEALTISGPFRSRSARWDHIARLNLDTTRRIGSVTPADPGGRERTVLIPFASLGPDASAELAALIAARRPDLA